MNATIRKLQEQGLNSKSHHAQIKKAYKEITGDVLGKEDLDGVRAMLEEAAEKPKKEKVALSQKAAMDRANEIVKERAGDEDFPGWDNVVKVAEAGPTGNPVRVVIECSDPQEQGGDSVCDGTREIAAQDVFQVRRCASCQKRANVIARNEAAKAKRAEAKKAAPKAKKSK